MKEERYTRWGKTLEEARALEQLFEEAGEIPGFQEFFQTPLFSTQDPPQQVLEIARRSIAGEVYDPGEISRVEDFLRMYYGIYEPSTRKAEIGYVLGYSARMVDRIKRGLLSIIDSRFDTSFPGSNDIGEN